MCSPLRSPCGSWTGVGAFADRCTRAEDEAATTDAAKMPPQPGDHFVFLSGPNKGQIVRLDNLAIGGPQVQVFPASPDGTVRNDTPLNLVVLTRFDPADLSEGRAAAEDDHTWPEGLRGSLWLRLRGRLV